MTTEDMDELLNAARPGIVESLKEELTKAITWDAKQRVINLVNAHVEEWVKANILPEITNELVAGKDGMIALGKTLGPAIVEHVTKGIALQVAETMKESYKRRQFFEAMFKY